MSGIVGYMGTESSLIAHHFTFTPSINCLRILGLGILPLPIYLLLQSLASGQTVFHCSLVDRSGGCNSSCEMVSRTVRHHLPTNINFPLWLATRSPSQVIQSRTHLYFERFYAPSKPTVFIRRILGVVTSIMRFVVYLGNINPPTELTDISGSPLEIFLGKAWIANPKTFILDVC
jgi:hypothetical protein